MRRLRLFGHPLHPATVHFPIGLLAGATVVDVLVALGLYAASLWFRHDTESAALVLATSLGGAAVLLLAGWFGGQLVYRYRQGVESSEIGHVGRKTQ